MVSWKLGTMGFAYKQWVGPFYPAGMAPRSFLAHYSQIFDAVEIDSTFYGPPSPSTVARWRSITPAAFTFCLKTPKNITHELRLVEAAPKMMAFLSTVRLLEDKLGAVLIQLPPDFTYQQFGVLMTFLKDLPTDMRFAVEFRHRSWDTPGTAALLERHNICWASTDYIHMPKTIRRTTDFLYLRFIGPHGQFPNKDREQIDQTAELEQWHQNCQTHQHQLSNVFAFFNNDYSGYSPATCNRFKRIVGVEPREIRPFKQKRLL